LLEQINRSLAMRERLTNERLKGLVAQIQALPILPSLYFKLLEHLRCAEPSALKIGQIIEQDVSMCLKMLQLVNSAFFGLSRQISSPAEALIYLGVETIQSLVLSLQVFSLFE
jgi:HD-like signal output (HDOD) protein